MQDGTHTWHSYYGQELVARHVTESGRMAIIITLLIQYIVHSNKHMLFILNHSFAQRSSEDINVVWIGICVPLIYLN